jgi:hypothetical protein
MAAPTPPAVVLPRWLILAGSAVILLHLAAIVANTLATTSGPWPSPEGGNMSPPPQFAFSVTEISAGGTKLIPAYLQAIKMTHTYHLATSRPAQPGAFFEVRLRDAEGNDLGTRKFPDPEANFWVRHRQSLLAQGLADDMPVVPPQTEAVAAPNKEAPHVLIWDGTPSGLRLRSVPEHLLPRDRPVFRPSDWSMLLARSYGRRLIRTTGANTVEIVRHSRDPYPPMVLFIDNAPAGAFEELVSTYAEVSK